MKQIVLHLIVVLDFNKYQELGINKPKEDIIAAFNGFAADITRELPEFEEVLSVKTKVEEINV